MIGQVGFTHNAVSRQKGTGALCMVKACQCMCNAAGHGIIGALTSLHSCVNPLCPCAIMGCDSEEARWMLRRHHVCRKMRCGSCSTHRLSPKLVRAEEYAATCMIGEVAYACRCVQRLHDASSPQFCSCSQDRTPIRNLRPVGGSSLGGAVSDFGQATR
jgi:hypothetical protein